MGEQRREVLGIDGEVLVVHPDDRLLIRLPGQITADQAHRVYEQVADVLGPRRALVFGSDVEIIVQRAEAMR